MGTRRYLASITLALITFSSQALAADYVAGEIIVKMKDNASTQQKHQFVGKASLQGKMSLKRSWTRFNMHQFRLKPGQSVENAINEALLDPGVEYAEPNYIFRKQSVGIEGEPMNALEVQDIAEVEGFAGGTDYGQAGSVDIMNVEGAWAQMSSTGSVPVVAVIDSGVDYNHDVFVRSGAIWNNADEIAGNGIDDDNNGYIDDVRGWNFVSNNNNPMDDDNHGTHVAGIVLGVTQNILKKDLSDNANPDPAVIRIMPLKFLDSNGSGSTSDAIEAINYAINNGAHILNNSWGGGSFSQALEDAVVTAYNSGKTFVAAAGNSANDNDLSPTYPASYSVPNIVSIAATESNDYLASFSNFGNQSVHVASPGVFILSTLPNNTYGYSTGTSMAAPISAGLAALLMHEGGTNINGFQMKTILSEQSHSVSNLAGKVSSQARVDALRALSYVQGNPIADYQPDYTSASRSLSSTSAAGCGMVSHILNKSKGQGGGKPPWGLTSMLLGLLFAPLLLINFLRRRRQKEIKSRRAFPRYKIDSQVSISVGGKELTGQVSSISLGGARIDTEAMLEDGGIVSMSISSPDGQQQIEVQGRVVWSEEKKAYGVKFCDAKDDAIAAIGGWTKKLAKVS